MRLKVLICACVIFHLCYGQNSKKNKAKSIHKTQYKAKSPAEIIAPNVVEFDSTALIILDGKVIKHYLYQNLLNKNEVEVVNTMQPKEAIQRYGGLARNGAIVANTIKK
jgi:hypothetical protein